MEKLMERKVNADQKKKKKKKKKKEEELQKPPTKKRKAKERFISVLISDITIVSLGFSTCVILIPTLKMDERTTTSTNSDDERLPLPPSAPGPATDAASRRQQHTIGAVRTLDDSRSPSASTATPSNATPARQSARLYPLFNGRNAGSGRNASAGRRGTAQRVSFSPAAAAASPVDAVQAGGRIEGVAVRALDTPRAGGTTGGVALRAPGPLPPRLVPGTVETAAASAANPGSAICTDGCAGGTCVDGRARTNTVRGTTADTVGVVGGAVGPPVAPCDGTPATASAAVVGDDAPADGDVQRALGHSSPRTFTEEQLRDADPRLQRLTAADRRLLGVFGDTIHLNDGAHLDGGIGVAEDAKWQRLYHRVASCSLPLYDLPNGRWAHRFLTTLTDLWAGVIQRRWNSERPLVFQAVILRLVRGITRFHDVKLVVWGRLDAWDAGRYVALVKEVEEANLDSGGGGRRVDVRRQDKTTSLARRYDAMVLGGKVRAAVRMVTNRGTGGPYRPNDLDSKSRRPVIDVLREKHPESVVPSEWDFDAYPDAADLLDTMPVYCFEECVAKAAA
ncbi:hypothetical protein ACHAXA_003000 [Cyclostephanos tholiformis]|uniref:Uncharacterized protein n=1 Tax=Cyclostephanos tholiformis TaxID=382380 RepID=A0ABD3SBZ2_9STRA